MTLSFWFWYLSIHLCTYLKGQNPLLFFFLVAVLGKKIKKKIKIGTLKKFPMSWLPAISVLTRTQFIISFSQLLTFDSHYITFIFLLQYEDIILSNWEFLLIVFPKHDSFNIYHFCVDNLFFFQLSWHSILFYFSF